MPKKPTCALITGSSSGIGAAFARVMAGEGIHLILVARRKQRLTELQQELRKLHPDVKVFVVPGDIQSNEARLEIWRDAVSLAAKEGLVIDCLINNAGLGHPGWFSRMAWQEIAPMLKVNIEAVTHFANLALTQMIPEKKGWICNVSSVAGFQPGPRMAVYYASKAFVTSLSEAMHWESKGFGVKITALCPGPVLTEFATVAEMQSSQLFRLFKPNTSVNTAKIGYKAMLRGRPVQIDTWTFRLFTFFGRFIPRQISLTATSFLNGAKIKVT